MKQFSSKNSVSTDALGAIDINQTVKPDITLECYIKAEKVKKNSKRMVMLRLTKIVYNQNNKLISVKKPNNFKLYY